MLVLTRKPGEQIVVGDNIVVTVQRVVGNKVSIAVAAPRDIPVFRSEVLRTRCDRIRNVMSWAESVGDSLVAV